MCRKGRSSQRPRSAASGRSAGGVGSGAFDLLLLNPLSTFAQFEREVMAARIGDATIRVYGPAAPVKGITDLQNGLRGQDE